MSKKTEIIKRETVSETYEKIVRITYGDGRIEIVAEKKVTDVEDDSEDGGKIGYLPHEK